MKRYFLVVLVLVTYCSPFLSYGQEEKDEVSQIRRINQLQVIGSHNSYKKAIAPQLFKFLEKKDTTGGIYSLQYEHIPIIDQLNMGLRNLELDAYADEKGGRFAKPKGLEWVREQPVYDPEGKMNLTGFKMLHVLDIDFRSDYYLLAECLADLRKWSDAHSNHETIFITLEPKDGDSNGFGTTPEPFTNEIFTALDSTLLRNLGRDHIIIPEDVKGDYSTLEEAVLHNNWPTLKQGRGKFLFILDAKEEKRYIYSEGHPSLNGRVMFINAEAGSPEAAAMIINDPENKNIPELVNKGYIIRTRADANTTEARNNDYSNFEAAKSSGAQIITTDYYLPSKLFKSSYHVSFDDGGFVRENPLNGK
tara:strand:- start:13667 stop:14755 length:1089 start_codon:yes stop_codon:yes gene_type:complete